MTVICIFELWPQTYSTSGNRLRWSDTTSVFIADPLIIVQLRRQPSRQLPRILSCRTVMKTLSSEAIFCSLDRIKTERREISPNQLSRLNNLDQ